MRVLLVTISCISYLNVQGQTAVVYDDIAATVNIAPHVRYFIDTSHQYTVQDIQNDSSIIFQTWKNDNQLNFGITQSKIWIVVKIDNKTQERLFLLQNNALIYYINVYTIDVFGKLSTQKSGCLRPYNTRTYNSTGFTFDLGKQPKMLIIEASTANDFYLPLSISSSNAIINEIHQKDVFDGFISGILLALALYNLFLFFSIREEEYLYLCTILFLYFIMVLRTSGLGFEYFWQDYPILNGGAGTLINLIMIAGSLFTIHFLQLKKQAPYFRYLFLFIIVAASILCVLNIITESPTYTKLTHLVLLVMMFSEMVIGCYIWFKGQPIALYYLVAFSCGNIAGYISSISRLGIIPFNFYTENSGKFGLVLLGVLMSNALSYKFNQHKREALEQAEENQRILQRQNSLLEQKVKERTQELSITNKALEKVNQTKDRIFAIIGHDLRKPVLAFRGITEKVNYLLESKDFNRLYKLGDTIEKEAFSLHRLTDNLLNWALMQRDVMPYHPENIMLKNIIDEIFEIFENVADDKEISLYSTINRAITVIADANALHTIIRNLVDNAIKYTPQGGRIELSAEASDQYLKIKIKDNGIGMTPEQVDQLFVLEKDKSQKGTDGEKGTGLGLHLVEELVTLNKGYIKVHSQIGEGTTFIIHLPSS